jgi:hypothetical protein
LETRCVAIFTHCHLLPRLPEEIKYEGEIPYARKEEMLWLKEILDIDTQKRRQ